MLQDAETTHESAREIRAYAGRGRAVAVQLGPRARIRVLACESPARDVRPAGEIVKSLPPSVTRSAVFGDPLPERRGWSWSRLVSIPALNEGNWCRLSIVGVALVKGRPRTPSGRRARSDLRSRHAARRRSDRARPAARSFGTGDGRRCSRRAGRCRRAPGGTELADAQRRAAGRGRLSGGRAVPGIKDAERGRVLPGRGGVRQRSVRR